jgi:coenzyme F420-reducing hydrogenase beta subunit/polysaccharide pyruvyl transferase WcaK-like protein
MTRIATVGAASSANKGAASMLQAVLDHLPEVVGTCEVSVLTTHLAGDRAEPPCPPAGVQVRLVDAAPARLAVLDLPLALLAWLARRLGLPAGVRRALLRTPSLRALDRADLVVDVAGISFSDGRGAPTTIYNAVMTGVPLLLGRPTVKCSQALGPFRTVPNRQLARLVLPRLVAVCPRGAGSAASVAGLGLTNARPAADLAFLMEVPPDAAAEAVEVLAATTAAPGGEAGADGPLVVVMPSSVAQARATRAGVDYPARMAALVDDVLARSGGRAILVPHSTRPGYEVSRLNDRGTCRQVHAQLRRPDRVALVDRSLRPTTLRALIGHGDLLVTSRFHAMISALATATPVLAIGWGHKYGEVLDELGLGECAADVADLAGVALADRAADLLARRDEVAATTAAALGAVVARARVNLDVLSSALGRPAPASPIVRDSLQGVIDAGMCIGCGACTVADPSVRLRIEPERQILLPDHASGPAAAAVCPAVQVDFAGLHSRVFPGLEVGPFGVVDSVWLAQSTDEPRNRAASSGGLIKELMLELLARDDVDGIIALGHVDGLDFAPRLVTEPHEVDELPGSIYHNLDQGDALRILRAREGRFVLVAIPCQLEGIYQYVHTHEPELAARIHTTIGLLCGWQYGFHAIRAISHYLGVDYDAIADIAYRGGGPVGKLRIRTRDGQEASASRRVDLSYQVAFDRSFNLDRCHTCINHSNFLADIVVGDAWIPATVFSRTGVSLVICRTPGSRRLLDELADDGRVVVAEASTDEIRSSQTDRVIFGDFAYAYADHLERVGVHHPDMVGPNRERATLADPDEVERFHRQLVRKHELQRQRRYDALRRRKATVELPALAARYWRWFVGRILRRQDKVAEGRAVQRSDLGAFR